MRGPVAAEGGVAAVVGTGLEDVDAAKAGAAPDTCEDILVALLDDLALGEVKSGIGAGDLGGARDRGPQSEDEWQWQLFSWQTDCHEATTRGSHMRIDAISIGKNPPKEVNVIVEVPVGGEPIKYEMDKAAGTLVVDRFLYTAMRYPGNYGFIPHTLSDDGDPLRRADRQPARHHSRRRGGGAPGGRAQDAGRGRRRREDHRRARAQAHPALRERAQLYRPAGDHAASRSSTSSSTTRIWNPASGSRFSAGAMPPKPRR